MIRLKALLLEQTEPKKLNVLFVGDSQTVANWSYANQLLKSGVVTGKIVARNGASTAQVLRMLQRAIADPEVKYDVISIMAGGNDGMAANPTKAIRNLDAAYNLAKQTGAKVVAISNPTKRFITKNNKKYFRPTRYPSNDAIAKWVNTQNNTDVKINTNNFEANAFGADQVHLNPTAQRQIADLWASKILGKIPQELQKMSQADISTGTSSVSGAGTSTSVTAAILPAGVIAKAEDVIRFFVNKGLTPEQAAGIAGNINQESAFNTAAVGDSGTSRGLAQWHNERWTRLEQWCKQNGFDSSSVEGQLEYLWHEMNSTESRSLSKIKQTSTPQDAAYAFAKYFERPSEISPRRMASAQTFFNSYKS